MILTNLIFNLLIFFNLCNYKFINLLVLKIKLYIIISGGTPSSIPISNLTINKFSSSFSGCLQDITFGSEPQVYRIDDYSQYEGENIGSCELYDEFIN